MAYPGRARLFEVLERVKEINIERKNKLFNHTFKGVSYDDVELKNKPDIELSFITVPSFIFTSKPKTNLP